MTIASEEEVPTCAEPRGAKTVQSRISNPRVVIRAPAVVMAVHIL
jgi:hypothetical protein